MTNWFLFAVIGTFALFALLQRSWPGTQLPRVRGWAFKGVAFFALTLATSTVLPLLWDEWLGQHRLLDGARLGTWGGALVGLLVVELGVYAWHRTLHRVNWLWRHSHQLHHSAERLDVYGAFYFHPLDLIGFAFVTSFALIFVAGVSAPAAMIVNGVVTFCSLFQHLNVRTPQWLGYVIQRPESHAVHHQRGVHAFNYSDLPIWDIVFGTFRNPAGFPAQSGLWDGASAQLGALLIGRDLSEAPRTPRSQLHRFRSGVHGRTGAQRPTI